MDKAIVNIRKQNMLEFEAKSICIVKERIFKLYHFGFNTLYNRKSGVLAKQKVMLLFRWKQKRINQKGERHEENDKSRDDEGRRWCSLDKCCSLYHFMFEFWLFSLLRHIFVSRCVHGWNACILLIFKSEKENGFPFSFL